MQITLRKLIHDALKDQDNTLSLKDWASLSVVEDKYQALMHWYTPEALKGASRPDEVLFRAGRIKERLEQADMIKQVIVHPFGGISIEIKRQVILRRLRRCHQDKVGTGVIYRLNPDFGNVSPSYATLMKLYFRTVGILHTFEEHGMIKDNTKGLRALSRLNTQDDLRLMMRLEDAIEVWQSDVVDSQIDKKLAIDVQNYYNNVALWAMPNENRHARWCLLEIAAWVMGKKIGLI